MDKEVKEILLKQLELLQKDSEKNGADVSANAKAMVEIAHVLAHYGH